MVRPTPLGRIAPGMVLMELVIALALSALLVMGLVQIAAAASASTRLQRNQAQMQEDARLAYSTLSRVIRRAGFNPRPWNMTLPTLGLAEPSADDVSATGDRLALRDWSDLNCFGNRNADTDASGQPRFYIREFVFDVNTDRSLTRLCRYGPSITELTTQVRRQGFINNIESLQLLYGEDSDRDGNIESWVRAGNWSGQEHILGIRIGLLHSSQDTLVEPVTESYQLLDTIINSPANGKLRRVSEFTVIFRGWAG